MADDSIVDQIDTAADEAKLALLKQIKKTAESTTSSNYLQSLGYAYALVVGAAVGKLPGGPTNVNVSK